MTRRRADQGPDLFAWGATQPVVCTELVQTPSPRCPQNVGGADKPHAVDCPASGGSEGACVVDFLDRRDSLPRRILNPPPPFLYLDRMIARDNGTMPPAPIIAFAKRSRPPDPGADGSHLGRTG
jgi:hypothetical protein